MESGRGRVAGRQLEGQEEALCCVSTGKWLQRRGRHGPSAARLLVSTRLVLRACRCSEKVYGTSSHEALRGEELA